MAECLVQAQAAACQVSQALSHLQVLSVERCVLGWNLRAEMAKGLGMAGLGARKDIGIGACE